MTDHPGDLAVVSAYFNPCGYKSRVRNHEAFREYMTALAYGIYVSSWCLTPRRRRSSSQGPICCSFGEAM